MNKPIFDDWQDATKVLPYSSKLCLIELFDIYHSEQKYKFAHIFSTGCRGDEKFKVEGSGDIVEIKKVKRWCYVVDIGNDKAVTTNASI